MLHKVKLFLYHFYFTILVTMIVICFFEKKLVDKKNDKVKFKIILNTNEESISIRYGCFRYIDC